MQGDWFARVLFVTDGYVFTTVSYQNFVDVVISDPCSVIYYDVSKTKDWVLVDRHGNPIVEKWTPEDGERYYIPDLTTLLITECSWFPSLLNMHHRDCLGIYKTREEAEERLEEIKKLLKK